MPDNLLWIRNRSNDRWTITSTNFAELHDVLGADVLSAFCRCFVHADRLTSAGQNVGVTQVSERIWLVTFMRYDLGYFDDETCRLEPVENPFAPKLFPCLRNEVLPMSPESTRESWSRRSDLNR